MVDPKYGEFEPIKRNLEEADALAVEIASIFNAAKILQVALAI
jgi:hypothetical protein